jgi:hypothetical protein
MNLNAIKAIIDQSAWTEVEAFILSELKPYEPNLSDSTEVIARNAIVSSEVKKEVERILSRLRSMKGDIKPIEKFV